MSDSVHAQNDSKTMTMFEPWSITTICDLPRAPLRRRVHHAVRQFGWATTRSARRVVSVLLHLSWRMDVTLAVDAEIFAADPDTAAATLEEFLRQPYRRVAVYSLACRGEPAVWRELGSAPIHTLRDTSVNLDEGWDTWRVATVATASVIVAARDIGPYSDSGLVPYPVLSAPSYLTAPAITGLVTQELHRSLTPVRRRHR